MYDAVWTVDHHPSLCGTAKFSHQLAQRLGVPVLPWGTPSEHPLISVRASEVKHWGFRPRRYDLFLHDFDPPRHPDAKYWVLGSSRTYAANVTIADQIRMFCPDVIEAWCPSTIQGNPHRGTINVLTFGMAHKIQTTRYEKLKTLLDATGEDYTVSVSTAIHEGSPWDETALVADRLRSIFGPRLRVLGYLADDALSRELRDCTAVALFFAPALRANNTTFWAAWDAGRWIITNLDALSPVRSSAPRVIEIDTATNLNVMHWPVQEFVDSQRYGWDRLTDLLRADVPCVK